MYTYTLQTLTPSGDVFVVEWDGDTIHGSYGPLHHTETDAIVVNPETMTGYEFTSDDNDYLSGSEWGYPLASYDPAQAN